MLCVSLLQSKQHFMIFVYIKALKKEVILRTRNAIISLFQMNNKLWATFESAILHSDVLKWYVARMLRDKMTTIIIDALISLLTCFVRLLSSSLSSCIFTISWIKNLATLSLQMICVLIVRDPIIFERMNDRFFTHSSGSDQLFMAPLNDNSVYWKRHCLQRQQNHLQFSNSFLSMVILLNACCAIASLIIRVRFAVRRVTVTKRKCQFWRLMPNVVVMKIQLCFASDYVTVRQFFFNYINKKIIHTQFIFRAWNAPNEIVSTRSR